MEPGLITAICGALAIIGGVFLWVVQMVVQKSIREAINGFATKLALLESRSADLKEALQKETEYSHSIMHERINSLANLQLESFHAGIEMGKIKAQARDT